MRVPDYNQMRIMLATSEAENINGNDLVELLLNGCDGYIEESNGYILEEFIGCYGEHQIPKKKIDIDKQQCTTCRNLVCICKD